MKRLFVALLVTMYIAFLYQYTDNIYLYVIGALPLIVFGWLDKDKLK